MTISFQGNYTKNDVLATAKLNRSRLPKETKPGETKTSSASICIYLGVMIAFISWPVGMLALTARQFDGMSFFFGFLLALSLAMFGLDAYINFVTPHVTWKGLEAKPYSFEGTVTDEALEIVSPIDSSSSQYQWGAFMGYGEHENTVALFLQRGSYVVIPRRAFKNDKDWEAFRKIVSQRLPVTHRVIQPTVGFIIRKIAQPAIVILILATITYLIMRP